MRKDVWDKKKMLCFVFSYVRIEDYGDWILEMTEMCIGD